MPRDRHPRRLPSSTIPGRERWIVSYADFITLLFAFFATLYAMSRVDVERFRALTEGVQQAFGANASTVPPARAGAPVSKPVATGSDSTLEGIRSKLIANLSGPLARGQVSLDADSRGLVISIHEAGSFAVGSAERSPSLDALLSQIAGAVRHERRLLRVEGHTDDRPIHNARFGSNWELSSARATGVVGSLLAFGIDADRLSATGYAEHRPVASNDTDEHRARNRRVDIVLLREGVRRR